MDGKMQWEESTLPNSPARIRNDTLCLNLESKVHSMAVSNIMTGQLSATETQIYTHDLIREVMEQSRANSIHHRVNYIDSDAMVYAKPKEKTFDQSHFDCIPPTDSMYASTYHSQIKDIQQKVNNQYLDRRFKNKRQSSSSARTSVSTSNPHVSVSAVVSHKFSSVRPKNSLGLRKINHQQNLVDQDNRAYLRTTCAPRRYSKIIQRSSKNRSEMKKICDSAIVGQFSSQTESFLGDLIQTKKFNTVIYGQKAKNLSYVKYLMRNQKTSFDEASFVVAEVIKAKADSQAAKKKQIRHQEPKKVKLPEQEQLKGRRMPPRTERVQVRQFYFME